LAKERPVGFLQTILHGIFTLLPAVLGGAEKCRHTLRSKTPNASTEKWPNGSTM